MFILIFSIYTLRIYEIDYKILTTTVPCISSNAKLGVGVGGCVILAAKGASDGIESSDSSSTTFVLSSSPPSISDSVVDVVDVVRGGIQSGEKAPVALPGFIKNLESYSKASNLSKEKKTSTKTLRKKSKQTFL